MRLLMLGCSERKVEVRGRLPAFQRYDGPAYRVFRKFLRDCPDSVHPMKLYVLSAKHGLISGDTRIPNYNLRMTANRAKQLKPAVQRSLGFLLSLYRYDEIFAVMGKQYREVISDLLPADIPATFAEGGIGEKSSALYHWLRRSSC